jgi:hypothetical protein
MAGNAFVKWAREALAFLLTTLFSTICLVEIIVLTLDA